ncbi:MAG TPA: endonuclease VII domain-containing protein [Acidimicrobiia bacterium]
MKRCKKCGELKPIDEFHRASGMRDGHRSECKSCHQIRQRAWYQANRDHAIAEVKRWQQENKEQLHAYRREYRKRRKVEERDAYLGRTFGISQSDYDELLARQGGGCAICGKKPGKISLHVDHDHATGEVRGLLCVGCNNSLGQMHDEPRLLLRAADYVTGDLPPLVDELERDGIVRDRARALVDVSG